MVKKKEESVMVMSDDLQKSLDSLQSFKDQTELVKSNCQQIVITDETTLAIGQQNLSKANDLLKYIEDKRIEIKAPYLVASKEIDRIGAELKQPVQDGIDHIKTQIKGWDAKLEERKKAEQKALEEKALAKAKLLEEQQRKSQEILASINGKYTTWFKTKLTECVNVETCEKTLAYIHSNYPKKETFLQHGDLAYELRDNYIAMIENKKQILISADVLSDEEIDIAKRKQALSEQKEKLASEERELAIKEQEAKLKREKEEADKKAEEERKLLLEKQGAEKTSGVRKIWKFELVDKSKLPLEWIALDESAVKLHLKSDDIKEGVMNGVKFYQEASVRA